jgi:hypothetical protein
MPYDLNFNNDSGPQRPEFEVIPPGTIVDLQVGIKRDKTGEVLTEAVTDKGKSIGVDFVFTITNGEFVKRKIWTRSTLGGDGAGHVEAARISRDFIRALLESAHGIRPDDTSEAAIAARTLKDWDEIEGITFVARVGVLPPRGSYKAKNTIDTVITPDQSDWHQPAQTKASGAASATTKSDTAIARPRWAAK